MWNSKAMMSTRIELLVIDLGQLSIGTLSVHYDEIQMEG